MSNEFQVVPVTEVNRRPRSGRGSTRYNGLVKAVGRLEIGQAVLVSPEQLGVEVDMADPKEAKRFQSNVAAAILRLVGKKLDRRHRVTIDAENRVVVERAHPLPPKSEGTDSGADEEIDADDDSSMPEDEDEDEDEEGFDEL